MKRNKDYPCYLVTCLDDKEEGEQGTRILATRTVFYSLEAALEYKKGINKSRLPQILPCFAKFYISKVIQD